MSALLTVSIIGLWAAAVYEPAIVFLSRQAGMAPSDAAKMAAYGTGLLSIGAIVNFGLTGAVAAIGTLGTPIATWRGLARVSRSRARPAGGEMPRRRRQDSGSCRPRRFGDDEAWPPRFTLAPGAAKPDNKAPG